MHNISQEDTFQHKSFFSVSKEWFNIFPFLLMPFCAFANVFLNKIQFQDLSRIYFFFLGTLCICTLRKDAVKKTKLIIYITLLFMTCNWVSVALASLKFEIDGIISSIKLAIDFFAFILIPLCGIQYIIDRINQKRLNQFYLVPVVIVIAVSIIQVFLMFGVKSAFIDYYSGFLYKYIEGSWDGVFLSCSNAISEFRVKSTFHEPSVFSSFFTLYLFPFIFCRYINGQYSFGKYADFIIIIVSIGCLLFSFSTTSYIMFTIDLMIIFYFAFRKRLTIKRFILIVLIIVGTVYTMVTYYDTYYRIVNRVFLFKSNKDLSSSTRIGSMVGAFNLFMDNPLGVGFSNEKYVVYDYLPQWGLTIEAKRERSNIQSHFLRNFASFGLPWICFCTAGLLCVLISYQKNKKYLHRWQREALFLWILNFTFNFIFGVVEYHSQWFLFSAVIIIGPIFKNYGKKATLDVEKYIGKKC